MTMYTNGTYNKTDGECADIPRLLLEEEVFAKVLKWMSLFEAIGIIVLNTVLLILLQRRKKPSRMAFFVHHLAIADLSVGVFYVLPECVFSQFLHSWEKYTCFFLHGFCTNLTIYASTFLIVVLTIDRLYVIVRPLSAAKAGKQYRFGLVGGAWALAVLLGIVYVIHIRFQCTVQGLNFCWHHFGNMKAIILAEVALNVVIPVCIISFCYIWIILVIRRREKDGFVASSQKAKHSNGSTRLTSNFKKSEHNHSSVITNAKKKTIKVLFVVVIVYILSWAPINAAQLLNVYNVLRAGKGYKVLHVLSPINSLMNPLVFIIFNRQMLQTEGSRKGYSHPVSSNGIDGQCHAHEI